MPGKMFFILVIVLEVLLSHTDGQIPGEYIASLKEGLPNSVQELERLTTLITNSSTTGNTNLSHTYHIGDFLGVAETTNSSLLSLLKNDSSVESIENNLWLNLTSTCMYADTVWNFASVWGLARISQRSKTTNTQYVYEEESGDGVLVYLVDTGVNLRHDFGGRVIQGPDVSRSQQGLRDSNGHGEHTAGIVVSSRFGIARNSTAIMIKAGDDTNDRLKNSNVLAALKWIAAHHTNLSKESNSSLAKSVINLPVASKLKSNALSRAISNIVGHQALPIVVGAGNSLENACKVFPANMTEVITVGAMDSEDNMWEKSNYGFCVDILAPGVQVWSDDSLPGSVGTYRNGTSVAAAHVTGVVARYLATQATMPSPAQVKTWLIDESTKDVLKVTPGTPNRLLYMGCNQSVTTVIPIQNITSALPINLTTIHMSNMSTAIPVTTTVMPNTTSHNSSMTTTAAHTSGMTTTAAHTSIMTTTMDHNKTTSVSNISSTETTASSTTMTPPPTTPSSSAMMEFSKRLTIFSIMAFLYLVP
ncbi:subtilisin-like protease CPC735_066880 [Lingula anatina]|uniref:Subtilisin-like protease CPC735_066880 n=1 Tax=Lingula anatina TaxID=7574 RepID=A0A2R2MRZ4_LINAN|nr:subtilisin-like protease CPC735_066880 [Lingula anatina]|eukprot:XP_023933029.1 subtilisin-like protease CPC735_066880 [Lingula anatina]